MRMIHRILTVIAILLIGLVSVGCGLGSQAASSRIPVSVQPHNGAVASYQMLHEPHTPSGTRLFRIMYWSRGVKVEEYLSEPIRPGAYPLLVNLHGGYDWPPTGVSHYPSPYNAVAAADFASTTAVIIYPEYQGYLDSSGTVHGMKTDVANTLDGIQAAKRFGEVRPHDTYLWGYSMGGGVALMTAELDHNVKAVVAVSPFVGLTDVVSWAMAHPPLAVQGYVLHQAFAIRSAYGDNSHSAAYRERSPNPAQIAAPVLLLQGTSDPNVAWQTVALFYHQMKAAHRPVQLILYPGGHHGLLGHRYGKKSMVQIARWFAKYGLRETPAAIFLSVEH